MKKGIIYTIVAILVLVLCYIIGQMIAGPKTIENTQSVYYDYTQKNDELVYEGREDTSDVPGGKTVGLVEDDIYDRYYLMTPNTSLRAGIIVDEMPHILTFQYMIHQSVSQLSDGMTLQIVVIREGTEEVLYNHTLEVSTGEKEYELSLEPWEGQNIYITFVAGNATEDKNGDWLVIKDAKIE